MKLAKLVAGTLLAFTASLAQATITPFDLASGNLFQDWSNVGLITVDDDWSGVPSINAKRGDGLTSTTPIDPQGVLTADDPGVVDVNANQIMSPNAFATGGATEFALADATIALAGSGTADAPYLRIHLDTTGRSSVFVSYRLRDLETGADNATQAVALHYRVGTSGAWTNLPSAFVADATGGPNVAGPDTLVTGQLPAAAENQPEVQVRIITTNATGNDEWVGIDDLQVTSQPITPVLSVANLSQNEGNMGITNFVFTASLNVLAVGNCDFSIDTFGGSATAGVDYVASTQNLSIADGTLSTTFTIQVNGDTDIEMDETFLVETFGEPQNCDIFSTADAVGTIVNDDSANIDVSIAAASVTEGNGGTVNLSLPVTLSASAPTDISIPFTVTAGSATQGSDYQTVSGNVLITNDTSTGAATVVVNGDLLDELDETLTVVLGAVPKGYSISTGSAVGTIEDDDAPPTIAVSSPSVTEGNAGTTSLTFVVSLSAASGLDVGFTRASGGGSATAGVDYNALAAAAANIVAGQTTLDVVVQINGDIDVEANETLDLNLTAVSNATPVSTSGTGTILNDDALIDVSIAAASVAEGNAGTVNLSLPVTLSAPAPAQVSIPFTVTAGTATTAVDYQTTSGNVVIAMGASAGSATVVVNGDLLDENNETVTVTLGMPPAGYTVVANNAIGTITDDDLPPTVSVTSPSVAEGNSGTSAMTFVVSLSASSGLDVGFTRATANGSATAGVDYAALTAAAGTITAGNTSTNIVVQINGDNDVEPNETLALNLTAISNAAAMTASGTGTITNDDTNIDVSIAAASVTEGSSGTVNLQLPVSLSRPALSQVSIPFVVTAGSATGTVDYQTTSGNVVIAGGSSAGNAVIVVTSDALDENDETLTVTLGPAPPNYAITTASAVGTIVDDDAAPTLSVTAPAANEGNNGNAPLNFVVNLSAPSSFDVTFNRQTSDGSATAGTDYVALAAGPATIVAGQTTTNVTVQMIGDFTVELNETVNLNLTAISNANPASVSAVGTISNDDALALEPALIPSNDVRGLVLLGLLLGWVSVVVLRRRG